MKKIYRTSVILTGIIFFSCSSPQGTVLLFPEAESLKQTVTQKSEEITWTKEIDGELLTKDLKSFENISSNIKLSPDLFNAIENNQEEVYPDLEDFGSLDISKANKKL